MIHLNGLLMGHSKMGILFQKGAQILQLHIYRIFIFKSILMQFFFYKLIVLVASRRMSTDFLYLYLAVSEINSIKRGQIPKFELSYFSWKFNAVFFFNKMIILLCVIDEPQKKLLLFYFWKWVWKGPKFCNFAYLESIFNTWNSKTRYMSKIQWVQQNNMSTLAFNIHLFNFPLSTCCGHIILRSALALYFYQVSEHILFSVFRNILDVIQEKHLSYVQTVHKSSKHETHTKDIWKQDMVNFWPLQVSKF